MAHLEGERVDYLQQTKQQSKHNLDARRAKPNARGLKYVCDRPRTFYLHHDISADTVDRRDVPGGGLSALTRPHAVIENICRQAEGRRTYKNSEAADCVVTARSPEAAPLRTPVPPACADAGRLIPLSSGTGSGPPRGACPEEDCHAGATLSPCAGPGP